MRLIVGFLSLLVLLGIGLLSEPPQKSSAHALESETDAALNRGLLHPIPLEFATGQIAI